MTRETSPPAHQSEAQRKRERLRVLLEKVDAEASIATPAHTTHPVSYPQQRLWFMQRLSPSARAYHVEAVTQMEGPLDIAALSRALSRVVHRHAVLRTTFCEVDGEPRQRVRPPYRVECPVVDLSAQPPHRLKATTDQLLGKWSRQPFDLERGPLLSVAVIRLSGTRHILAMYMHHIVADGWSMGILGRELDALYQEEIGGKPADLPALRIQYTDFARWQRANLAGAALEQPLAYWRQELQDLPTLVLPWDHPRPAVQDHEGGHVNLIVPIEVLLKLRSIAMQEGATLFMVLFAAFSTLLHRWSGEEDLPVGTFVANRTRPEIEPLIGFFLNTLVLRARVDPDTTFRGLLQNIREVALNAYDHQEVPFEVVVATLAPRRDLSRNPLFQIVFHLNNSPTQDPQTNTLEAARAQREAAIFDLGLMLFETAKGLGGQFEYDRKIFDQTTVEGLARHFLHLLRAVADNPDRLIGDVPLMSDPDIRHVLAGPNNTRRDYPWDVGILDLFGVQSRRHPDRIAFQSVDGVLTYAELSNRADSITAALQEQGVLPGDVVGIELDRCLELPVTVLGTLGSGGAWLPIDPAWPRARRDEACARAGVRCVISRAGAPAIPGVDILDVTTLEAPSRPPSRHHAKPGDPAYVMFTSGSTGAPKGVVGAHGQVLNRFHWMWDRYPWRANEVAVMKTSATFVDSVWEIFGALLQGVPTTIVQPSQVADVDKLVSILERDHVTRLWLVPSLLRALLEDVPNLRKRLPHLDFLVASGEDLPLATYQRCQEVLPHARLFNLYGTTEIWDATWWDPAMGGSLDKRVPLGTPIDNVRTYVLDRRGQPQPVGWPGELHVAGAGLALGYLGGSGDAFRYISFLGRRQRLYSTGDRVVLHADHQLEFLGRLDGQGKVRGVRVEPAEIEAALYSHPQISACAAAILPGPPQRLVAWIQTVGRRIPDRILRQHLARLLLPEALPQHFIRVDHIPTTISGKVDRQALAAVPPAVETPSNISIDADEPPRGALETWVANCWSELLGVPVRGRDSDFFADLGGHSLLAVRSLSRVRDDHHVSLPLHQIFERPTVRGLAQAIAEAVAAGDGGNNFPAAPIPRVARTDFAD